MRQITPPQILSFFALLGLILVLALGTTALLFGRLSLGDFRGVTLLIAAVVFIYIYAFFVYRLFLIFVPLQEGELKPGSRAEFAAQVNILFYLMLFNTLIRTHFLPVPLMRLVYQALGTKMGPNTYSAGTLLDPPLTEFGANCIVGHDAVLYSHAIEGDYFALSRIRVGNEVTIGAKAIVMSGVTVGDGAIVSAGALVLKDTQIAPGEIWGGVPARCLGRRSSAPPACG